MSISVRDGMLRLRWRHQGQRYELRLGLPDSPLARHRARKVASDIELDIASGHFDTTLAKYKEKPPEPSTALISESTAQLFAQFTESRRRAGAGEYNLRNVYGSLARYLDRFGRDIASPDDAAELLAQIKAGKLQARGQGCGDRTLNKYLSLYRHFSSWAVANDYWPADHFRRIEAVRTERSRASRKAFSDGERRAIFEAMAEHEAYQHYLPFTKALFWLGWRPSEIIGLRWRDIEVSTRSVTVGESLSRDVQGRRRKGTKAGVVRTLQLNPGQWAIIEGQGAGSGQQLLFLSPKGKPIEDRTFWRLWQKVLTAAEVEYRPPYTARHTFATWAKRHGMTDEALAYWMGHKNTQMVRQHYSHLDEAPVVPMLPND